MENSDRTIPYFIYSVTLIIIFYVRISIPVELFGDFEGYRLSVERLLSSYENGWLVSDPLGWAPLIALYYLFGNIYDAIYWSNMALSLIFFFGLIYIGEKYVVVWQGILVLICLFGSLLAFITIRATPAYLLITVAALETNNRKQVRPIVLLLLASLFHGSALLAAPGIIAGILCHRSKTLLSWVDRPQKIFLVLAVLLIPVYLFQDKFKEILLNILDIFSDSLGRFSTYLPSDRDYTTVDPNMRSNSDLYYAIFVFTAFSAFMIFSSRHFVRIRAFILLSFIVFTAMLFQPTAAFRQSLYWLVPMILVFPWKRFEFGGAGNMVLIIGCAVVGYLGFQGVLI
jgi:hypothetical protein